LTARPAPLAVSLLSALSPFPSPFCRRPLDYRVIHAPTNAAKQRHLLFPVSTIRHVGSLLRRAWFDKGMSQRGRPAAGV
jgi:hypothetical protein